MLGVVPTPGPHPPHKGELVSHGSSRPSPVPPLPPAPQAMHDSPVSASPAVSTWSWTARTPAGRTVGP